MRNKAERETGRGGEEKTKLIPTAAKAKAKAQEFVANSNEQTKPKAEPVRPQFTASKSELTAAQKTAAPASETKGQKIAKDFTANKADKTLSERERIRQAFAKEREANKGKSHDRGMEWD